MCELDDLHEITDPMARAAEADRLMWILSTHRLDARHIRDKALHEALTAGATPADLAARLNVKPTDIAIMASESSILNPDTRDQS
ncbi:MULTISPECIES: hypothetical protein [Protofrankia]|uniref:hypothetical protein n=1 Tax=Protofrankia TaxID=2994361 RepID=UPI00104182D8|nr:MULTISPECIES: hypothetical protein [Protofrankia]